MEVIINSPLGNIRIVESENRIIELSFSKKKTKQLPDNDFLKSASIQLNEYFSGKRKEFELEMAPKGTDFQQKVWDELLKIPYGVTISYLELANRLGDPKTIRAAAGANGKNPIGIIIPCHRVIGSHGEMTGYAGGIEKKKALLKLEGASVMNQLEMF
ncbi:MAG: methylated-DNA--[protein]-cysteine S-methyltransferase [Bacteroidota bacterium]